MVIDSEQSIESNDKSNVFKTKSNLYDIESNVSSVEWTAESQVALARVGAKYGFNSSEVQKMGATLMVFLTSLE